MLVLILASLLDAPAKKPGKALSRTASRQNRVRGQASHSRKQQTTRSHSVHWWLSHQRPITVKQGPQRQCSLKYGLNLQLDNGGRSSHPCPQLDCLKGWQSDHTCHHPHRFNALVTEREKWYGKPDWNVSMVDIHFWKLLWVHCPGHAGVQGNDWADRLAGKATITSSLLKCLMNLRHYLWVQSIVWRREAWREEVLDNLPWKDETGPSSIRWTLELFQRQRWGNFWETGWSAYGLFRAHRYYLEMKCTELDRYWGLSRNHSVSVHQSLKQLPFVDAMCSCWLCPPLWMKRQTLELLSLK